MSTLRTAEEVFNDFAGRRRGILRALIAEPDRFYAQCDPSRENLCLYGYSDGSYEVSPPAEEVPPELPEPALGINYARDGMRREDWLSLVALHSDSWLAAVAFCNAAKMDAEGRRQLFNFLNSVPSVFESVTERARQTAAGEGRGRDGDTGKGAPDGSGSDEDGGGGIGTATNPDRAYVSKRTATGAAAGTGIGIGAFQPPPQPSGRGRGRGAWGRGAGAAAGLPVAPGSAGPGGAPGGQLLAAGYPATPGGAPRGRPPSRGRGRGRVGRPPRSATQAMHAQMAAAAAARRRRSAQESEEEEEEEEEEESDEEAAPPCPNCGRAYVKGDFWVACDCCDRWFDGDCVGMTPASAERQPNWICPLCISNGR